MKPRDGALGKFVLHTFLWLPVCFAAWYFSAPYHSAAIGELARILIDQVHYGTVTAIERAGVELVFVTSIKVQPTPGQSALLLPQVNPLLYTFGLPFFLALMLAARSSWWKILLGAVLLLPFQSWGVGFDFLAQVGTKFGADAAAQAELRGWRLEAVALSYQVGSLIFPTLIPVMLWAGFNRRFIEVVLRGRADTLAESGRR
ncbi:hypothetical protein BH11PSE11_BH11PSE11_19290 [soil metagenome]